MKKYCRVYDKKTFVYGVSPKNSGKLSISRNSRRPHDEQGILDHERIRRAKFTWTSIQTYNDILQILCCQSFPGDKIKIMFRYRIRSTLDIKILKKMTSILRDGTAWTRKNSRWSVNEFSTQLDCISSTENLYND